MIARFRTLDPVDRARTLAHEDDLLAAAQRARPRLVREARATTYAPLPTRRTTCP